MELQNGGRDLDMDFKFNPSKRFYTEDHLGVILPLNSDTFKVRFSYLHLLPVRVELFGHWNLLLPFQIGPDL